MSTTDDKRLQATLKRLGVNTIPGIEEVNLFVENDVIHFTNPKGVHQHHSAAIHTHAGYLPQCVAPDQLLLY